MSHGSKQDYVNPWVQIGISSDEANSLALKMGNTIMEGLEAMKDADPLLKDKLKVKDIVCEYCHFVNPVPDFPMDVADEVKPDDYKGLGGKPLYMVDDWNGKTYSDWWDAVLYKQPNGKVILLANDGNGYWTESKMTFEFCPKCGRRLNA